MSQVLTYSFCDNYLEKLAEYIFKSAKPGNHDFSRIAIVFGGKRPAMFLKRALAKRIQGEFYPPTCFTIDEFMSTIVRKKESFFTTADLDQCYLMFKLAREVAPDIFHQRKSFSQFLPWTHEILSFIDNLDLENIPNNALSKIEANAQIGYPVPEDINKLLESIAKLRLAYHDHQNQSREFSRGFQYLRAADLIGELKWDEFDQILFCNFFYFHRTEEKVVKELLRQKKASLIFQGDERKWPILKRSALSFDTPLLESEVMPTPGFELQLYQGFDVHSQVAQVREIIKKLSDKERENTVIVLPNADNLIPLLSEIAPMLKEFNVSMGYPLRRSSLIVLFKQIFQAQSTRKEKRYYARDYLKLLRHPFIKNLTLNGDARTARILVHKIEEVLTGEVKGALNGVLFFELEEIENSEEIFMLTQEMLTRMGVSFPREQLVMLVKEMHQICFRSWEEIGSFEKFALPLGTILDNLLERSFIKNFPLNVNIAAKMYAIRDEFSSSSFKQEPFESKEIFKIFEDKIINEKISFAGSPLKGLQILGLFETRSLNFENVIILDVNEGTLPSLKIYEPFIPREVMISLNLDRLEWEEEIQRYQFMRLISSAKKVHCVYQQSHDKERSRFIEELIWEEQKKQNKLDLSDPIRSSFAVQVSTRKKSVSKTPAMIDFIRQMKFSASSINMYVRNPLEFYYAYVLGLKEKDDLLDEPEARQVGTFVHEVLETAYKPFKGKKPNIDAAFRVRFSKIFEDKFENVFGRSMRSDAFLLKSVLEERLKRFLDNEADASHRHVETVMYLEEKFEDTIRLPSGDFHFKYIVDRVDKLADGTIMIVDYKTGSTDKIPNKTEAVSVMELTRKAIKESIKSFQIPLYFCYLDKQFPNQPINAALYNMRTLEMHKFLDLSEPIDRPFIRETFLKALDFILSEILDPNIAFEDDEDDPFE